MSASFPRTTVEFVDTSLSDGVEPTAHVVSEVRVNGVPVAVAENGAAVEFSANDLTKVTLELVPTYVRFIHDGHGDVCIPVPATAIEALRQGWQDFLAGRGPLDIFGDRTHEFFRVVDGADR